MKHNAAAALALLGLALSLEGCGGAMGLGVGVVTRAAGTGDAYAAWKASAPPVPPGLGRLFVYAPNRQVSVWTADWATGGEFVFDVDRDVCDVIGSSFAYVDLPAGAHSLSASDIKKFPGGFQIGKYSTTVRIRRRKDNVRAHRACPRGADACHPRRTHSAAGRGRERQGGRRNGEAAARYPRRILQLQAKSGGGPRNLTALGRALPVMERAAASMCPRKGATLRSRRPLTGQWASGQLRPSAVRKERALPDGSAATCQPTGESRREDGLERQKFGRTKQDAPTSGP